MIINLPTSLFIDIWKLHFGCFWSPQLQNVIIRFGRRQFQGKFIRISFRDPVDVAHKDAVALATTLHKLEHLPQDVKRRFMGMTKQEQVEMIRRDEQALSSELHEEIQAFVIEHRKQGIGIREIKRLVKKKYKVEII